MHELNAIANTTYPSSLQGVTAGGALETGDRLETGAPSGTAAAREGSRAGGAAAPGGVGGKRDASEAYTAGPPGTAPSPPKPAKCRQRLGGRAAVAAKPPHVSFRRKDQPAKFPHVAAGTRVQFLYKGKRVEGLMFASWAAAEAAGALTDSDLGEPVWGASLTTFVFEGRPVAVKPGEGLNEIDVLGAATVSGEAGEVGAGPPESPRARALFRSADAPAAEHPAPSSFLPTVDAMRVAASTASGAGASRVPAMAAGANGLECGAAALTESSAAGAVPRAAAAAVAGAAFGTGAPVGALTVPLGGGLSALEVRSRSAPAALDAAAEVRVMGELGWVAVSEITLIHLVRGPLLTPISLILFFPHSFSPSRVLGPGGAARRGGHGACEGEGGQRRALKHRDEFTFPP